jgi:enoyl-CoA hydratase
MRTDKKAAILGFGLPLKEGLKIEAQCFNEGFNSEDTLEGLRMFVQRDHPDRRKDGGAAPVGKTGVKRSRL